MKTFMSALTMVFVIGGAAAQDAGAQSGRAVSLRAGGLMYDRGGDATNLMLGAGMEWPISRHILAEVEGSWSASDGTFLDYTQNPQAPVVRETNTHLATATAGVQAQALIGRLRPYVGLSAGLFVRYDEEGGDRFVNRTFTVPGGVRIDLTDRIGLRGELRMRFDTHQDGGSGTNLEQTAGITFRF